MEMNEYIRKLKLSNLLRESMMRAAIRGIDLPAGSKGLDVGSGAGNITALLAEQVGPAGHVTGLDISPEMVAYAGESAREAGLSGQLSFRKGDMNAMPFDDHSFDWTWSVDCVGYAPVDLLPLLEELKRVVRPGGRITFMAWSSQQLLPGYPVLEARLNATTGGIAPFATGSKPERHLFRSLHWFQQAGLAESEARTFIADVHAPLEAEVREALLSLIQMRWPGVKAELSQGDWRQFQQLTDPASPDFILDLPDYYAFFTYSLFSGLVPDTA